MRMSIKKPLSPCMRRERFSLANTSMPWMGYEEATYTLSTGFKKLEVRQITGIIKPPILL